MADDEYFLAHVALDAAEWRSLLALADSFLAFEPLARRSNVGSVVAERLVMHGLAERGPAAERYAHYGEGYRLTELGWLVKGRGRFPPTRR